MAKCTLGTGGFFIVNIGNRPVRNIDEIITRICWHLGDRPIYGLEGAIFHVGTLLEWLCNKLRFVESVEQSAKIAAGADSRGLYIVPAFSGLGSPFWDANAKVILVGASLETGPAELIRAGLEAIAFRIQDIVEAMKKSVSIERLRFRFDGNVSMNDTLMQIVAGQMQCEIERSSSFKNRSALGAAFLAGLHAGFWHDLDEIAAMWSPNQVFYPQKNASETYERYQGWQDAVSRSRGRFIS
jgi:glycerol kinase